MWQSCYVFSFIHIAFNCSFTIEKNNYLKLQCPNVLVFQWPHPFSSTLSPLRKLYISTNTLLCEIVISIKNAIMPDCLHNRKKQTSGQITWTINFMRSLSVTPKLLEQKRQIYMACNISIRMLWINRIARFVFVPASVPKLTSTQLSQSTCN